MRALIARRYVLSIGVAAAFLAGCGGRSQLPIATPEGVNQPLPLPAAGVVHDAKTYLIVHAFRTPDGNWPQTLTRYNRDIFGETVIGGSKTCGCGVVFKLSPSGSHYAFSILHVFTGGSNDGADPQSLIATSNGTLYGSTRAGGGTGCSYSGSVGCGIIFKLVPSGSGYAYSILYRFENGAGGYGPGLMNQRLSDGDQLLGIAGGGARKNCSCGIIFELVRSGSKYTERVLWNFRGGLGDDGPGGNAMVVNGKIYGTAYGNGDVDSYAYRFDSGRMTILHKFRQSDARNGTNADLTVSDPAGNLYGSAGGGNDRCVVIRKLHQSCGLIYELVAAGGKYTERVLRRFSPGPDGFGPGVSLYHNGTLYGYTAWGGNNCDGQSGGCGVVFAISASTGKETVLYRFSGGVHGAFPSSNLLRSTSESVLYGATQTGGERNAGTVFQLGY
jgi:uncharacterized repeat protein (TIGR03803 family)